MTEEIDILIVEDNASDVELIREALSEIEGAPHRIQVASDGEDALRILAERTERPHLVILDLNLPKVSGFEVLRAVKKDPALKTIPVIILTNSQSQDDVARCYNQYANAYIRKPIGYDKLAASVKVIWQFWVDTALLPTPSAATPVPSIPPSSPSKT